MSGRLTLSVLPTDPCLDPSITLFAVLEKAPITEFALYFGVLSSKAFENTSESAFNMSVASFFGLTGVTLDFTSSWCELLY